MLPYILITAQNFSFAGLDWQKIGAVMVPINARFMYEESAWIINHCQAHFCGNK